MTKQTVRSGRDPALEAAANDLLWRELERIPPGERPTKTAWAAQFGLNYRWLKPQTISLEGLMEAAEAENGAAPQLRRLGTVAAPPTQRRHSSSAALEAASRDPDATRRLEAERADLYCRLAAAAGEENELSTGAAAASRGEETEITPGITTGASAKQSALSEGVLHRGDSNYISNLRRRIREIGEQLYQLCGDTPIPNCDPLTWDTSFYERIPLDLTIRPICNKLELDWDSTLGIYSTTYDFGEMVVAIESNELAEWWATLDETAQRRVLSHYWSYNSEIAAAAKEGRLIDLCDAAQVDRILGEIDSLKETPVWEVLELGARIALDEVQWTIFELKMEHRSNRDICAILKQDFEVEYRENYISTIWHKQITAAIATRFQVLEEEIQALAIPELWKRCKSCGRRKLATTANFVKRKQCSDGLAGICKECDKKKRQEKKLIEAYKEEQRKKCLEQKTNQPN